jgi:peptidoglycan/LPS O-acetylase OafA/YrhL
MESSLARRGDIDGLRAIAVAAVILFHWNLTAFSGGFVGVDVFFVISGFLIASTLRSDIERGRFSALAFYERRLRRIVPALFVVVLAVVAVSPFVFLPNDIGRIGDGAVTSVVFLSNLLFMGLSADYFEAGDLGLQPLLHTWSLSVEAQFYLLAPLLALAFLRWGTRRFLGLLVALIALSFAASAWGAIHWPAGAFYLLATRAWELLLGGFLAFRVLPALPRPWQSDALAAAGLICIGAAVFGFTPGTPFPGFAALLPCLGAAFLLQAGAGSQGFVSGRVLASTPMAFIGRISYSLYLWHWPVLVVLRYQHPDGLPLAAQVTAAVAIFALSVLSWRFVEQPFLRKQPAPVSLRQAATGLAGLMLLCLAGGGALHLGGRGVIDVVQLPPEVTQLANAQFDRVEADCEPTADRHSVTPRDVCYLGRTDAPPTVLLWGNSFGRMLIPAIEEAAHRQGGSAVATVMSRCPPIEIPTRAWCSAFNASVFAYLERNPSIQSVVLSANWQSYGFASTLEKTIATLVAAGKRVYVVLPPPRYSYNVPRTLALAKLHGTALPAPLSMGEHIKSQAPLRAYLEDVAARHLVTLIAPDTILCRTEVCAVAEGNTVFYYDSGHLSGAGARHVSALFDQAFELATPTASQAERRAGSGS